MNKLKTGRSLTSRLSGFLKWSCMMAGKPASFVLALTILLIWFVTGLFVGFSDTWLLIINTIGTINAALMVFIIQNTQNRQNKAMHLKIDELILAIKEAKNELIAIEEIEEEELERLKTELQMRKREQEKT